MRRALRRQEYGFAPRRRAILVWTLALLAPVSAVQAGQRPPRPGDLDVTFGYAGAILRPIPEGGDLWAVAVQDDGKVLAAGGPAGTVSRYLPDGRVDEEFGEHGVASLAAGLPALDVQVQPGRGIAVLGWSPSEEGLLTRTTDDGSLDRSFGIDGRAPLPELPALCGPNPYILTTFDPVAMAVAHDGKILVAGTLIGWETGPRNIWVCDRQVAVLRYGADGLVDERFGEGGIALLDFDERWGMAHDIALQPNGGIVIGGAACLPIGGNGGNHTYVTFCSPDQAGILVRLTRSGALDRSFGKSGIAATATAEDLEIRSIAALPSGSIVSVATNQDGSFVSRWTSGGVLDRRFADAGNASVPAVMGAALAIDPAGRVVVAGRLDGWFGIARLQSNGRIDGQFGYFGVVATVEDGAASAVLVQPDGAIVVGGAQSFSTFALVRLRGG